MSLLLGIDTSSTDLGIGLFRDGLPAASYSRFLRNSHAETIAQAVSLVLDNNGFTAADVTHIAVSAGPGSFTGLRIGISFVKGFCLGGGIPVLPLSSLFILAHGGLPHPGPVVAAIDARRDEVFWARFTIGPEGILRETPDLLSPALEFMNVLKSNDTVVTDTMGYSRSTVFNRLASMPSVVSIEKYPLNRGFYCAATGASAITDAAARQEATAWQDATDVLPHYLRSFAPPPAKGEKR